MSYFSIAAAMDNGSVVFLDIYRHAVLFSENIVRKYSMSCNRRPY